MTADLIIAGILKREGSIYTESANDPPTKYGITLDVLGEYLGRSVTADDVKAVTADLASAVYLKLFVAPYACVSDDWVRVFLIDWAVLQGRADMARHVQRWLGLATDGVFGPKTLAALNAIDSAYAKQELLCQRAKALIRDAVATNKIWALEGWLMARVFAFL